MDLSNLMEFDEYRIFVGIFTKKDFFPISFILCLNCN